MDTEFCRSFGKDCVDDLREQSLLFVLCHEFIRISRSLRYLSGNLTSLSLFVDKIFACDSQSVIDEYSLLA